MKDNIFDLSESAESIYRVKKKSSGRTIQEHERVIGTRWQKVPGTVLPC